MERIFQKNRAPLTDVSGVEVLVFVPDPENPVNLTCGYLVEYDRDAGDALVRLGTMSGGVDVGYSIANVYLDVTHDEWVEIIGRDLSR